MASAATNLFLSQRLWAGFYLSFCLSFGLAFSAWGWSGQGHRNLTQVVFEQLDEPQQQYFKKLFSSLILEDVKEGTGVAFTSFAEIGDWADQVRDDKIEVLFAQYGQQVPKALSHYVGEDSRRWHYFNAPVGHHKKHCSFRNAGLLVDVLTDIDRVFFAEPTKFNAMSEQQKALLLAFQIHLIQDAHQPLHTITYVKKNCRHDLGGNSTCVKKEGKRCVLNLHQMWDGGFGVLSVAKQRSLHFNRTQSSLLDDFNPMVWMMEGELLSAMVYPQGHNYFNPIYVAKGEDIVSGQTVQLQQRLRNYLTKFYTRHKHGKD